MLGHKLCISRVNRDHCCSGNIYFIEQAVSKIFVQRFVFADTKESSFRGNKTLILKIPESAGSDECLVEFVCLIVNGFILLNNRIIKGYDGIAGTLTVTNDLSLRFEL